MATWKSFGFDIDTRRYLDAIAVTGGSISYGSAQAVNTFVEGCKASGVWDAIIDCGIFVGNDLNAATTKLKWWPGVGPYLGNAGFVEGDYVERGTFGGISGATNKSLDTKIGAYILPYDNGHMAAYLIERPNGAAEVIMGIDNANGRTRLDMRTASQQFSWGGPAIIAQSVTPPSSGFYCVSRVAANLVVGYSGITPVGTNATLTTQYYASGTINFMAGNTVLGPADWFTHRAAFYSIGLGLTPVQVTGLYTNVQALQVALGRNT